MLTERWRADRKFWGAPPALTEADCGDPGFLDLIGSQMFIIIVCTVVGGSLLCCAYVRCMFYTPARAAEPEPSPIPTESHVVAIFAPLAHPQTEAASASPAAENVEAAIDPQGTPDLPPSYASLSVK
eukprot:TRINITY_DN11698_c0_g1_i11.p2 TRINITY_DN11698_c0_g1~~TRINITY_DN11698_c0_g1_i11.p2  ORF type:complete len:127 (+),score=1.14 TRINITY_DN11698_c0_g1_i11:982-1362(+)